MKIGKKITHFVSAVVFSTLFACNILTPAAQPPAPTQNLAIIFTQAALTIAAQSSSTLPVTLLPTDTQPIGTSIPTDTPLPPTSTATSTLPPTATFVPDDPRKTLGNPDFFDPFDSPTNWYIYSDKASSTQIKNGRFLMTVFNADDVSRWTLSWPVIKNAYLEVVAQTPETCSGKDRYGLIFRAPDVNHGYIFALSCDGYYRLSKWDGKNFDILVNWIRSEAIAAGASQTNVVGVMAVGEELSLYANGVFLTKFRDQEYTSAGRFGILIGAANTADFTVMFDNFAYWLLD